MIGIYFIIALIFGVAIYIAAVDTGRKVGYRDIPAILFISFGWPGPVALWLAEILKKTGAINDLFEPESDKPNDGKP